MRPQNMLEGMDRLSQNIMRGMREVWLKRKPLKLTEICSNNKFHL